MKKVKFRANSALIISALLIAGMLLYIVRLVSSGSDWAAFPANRSVYSDGVLNTGVVYDREGVILAKAGDGVFSYADDAAVRAACLHVVGDFAGNIGTGAIKTYSRELIGYGLVSGTYDREGLGGEITLSIDSELNKTAWNALNGRRGAVLVMDYDTGEILCMVSAPSYDPANVPDLSGSAYEGVFLNRTISSTFTPGSVFKIITMAAAIENIPDLGSKSFSCAGSTIIGGGKIVCSGWHGQQNIEQAFANSCNCAFAELSVELGADTLYNYADALGFMDVLDIDGIPTAAGSFDRPSDGSSDLAWFGIGQYTDLVSPFSMMRLTASIAGGGIFTTPTILAENRDSQEGEFVMKSSTANELKRLMRNNVVTSYGEWTFPGLNLCGKTGTAEVGEGKTPHSWFVGFLDDTEHPLAFAVLVENGGSGLGAAGAVANSVLQAAVNR